MVSWQLQPDWQLFSARPTGWKQKDLSGMQLLATVKRQSIQR